MPILGGAWSVGGLDRRSHGPKRLMTIIVVAITLLVVDAGKTVRLRTVAGTNTSGNTSCSSALVLNGLSGYATDAVQLDVPIFTTSDGFIGQINVSNVSNSWCQTFLDVPALALRAVTYIPRTKVTEDYFIGMWDWSNGGVPWSQMFVLWNSGLLEFGIVGQAVGFSDGTGITGAAKFGKVTSMAQLVSWGPNATLMVDAGNYCIRYLLIVKSQPLAWTISTVAGTNTAGYVDAAGTAARFRNPLEIVQENVTVGGVMYRDFYIADQYYVRKMTFGSYSVTALAGNGTGDVFTSGPALQVSLGQVWGVGIRNGTGGPQLQLFISCNVSSRLRLYTGGYVLNLISSTLATVDGVGVLAQAPKLMGMRFFSSDKFYFYDNHYLRIGRAMEFTPSPSPTDSGSITINMSTTHRLSPSHSKPRSSTVTPSRTKLLSPSHSKPRSASITPSRTQRLASTRTASMSHGSTYSNTTSASPTTWGSRSTTMPRSPTASKSNSLLHSLSMLPVPSRTTVPSRWTDSPSSSTPNPSLSSSRILKRRPLTQTRTFIFSGMNMPENGQSHTLSDVTVVTHTRTKRRLPGMKTTSRSMDHRAETPPSIVTTAVVITGTTAAAVSTVGFVATSPVLSLQRLKGILAVLRCANYQPSDLPVVFYNPMMASIGGASDVTSGASVDVSSQGPSRDGLRTLLAGVWRATWVWVILMQPVVLLVTLGVAMGVTAFLRLDEPFDVHGNAPAELVRRTPNVHAMERSPLSLPPSVSSSSGISSPDVELATTTAAVGIHPAVPTPLPHHMERPPGSSSTQLK